MSAAAPTSTTPLGPAPARAQAAEPASAPTSSPAATVPTTDWLTLHVASANLLNLALPERSFYANQEPYSRVEHERKVAWLAGMFERLNADVIGVQEVWDEAALKAVAAAAGAGRQRALTAVAPGAENTPGSGSAGAGGALAGGATGTPRVGLVTRLPVVRLDSVAEFAASDTVMLPEIGLLTRFERPVLRAELRTAAGMPLHVLVVHLKSKRPKYLQDEAGTPLEDRDDPAVTARATMRSLLQRAAEAAALRRLVVQITGRGGPHQGEPLLLLGDLNDSVHAVTTQMIAANQAAAFDRAARDVALYHALEVATEPALKRDLAYSHIHQGWPELLDQIWVSEELVASSRFAMGDVRRVEVFNDHLHESRERWRSDHGFVRALVRLKRQAPAAAGAASNAAR